MILDCFIVVIFSRQLARAKKMYEDFISSKETSLLKEQERQIIINQLKRRMCIAEGYYVNDKSNILDACSDYELGNNHRRYIEHEHTRCIGNWPGFLMTKMPYQEREF